MNEDIVIVAAGRTAVGNFGGSLAGCIRITVGSEEQNDRLLQCLRKMRGERP